MMRARRERLCVTAPVACNLGQVPAGTRSRFTAISRGQQPPTPGHTMLDNPQSHGYELRLAVPHTQPHLAQQPTPTCTDDGWQNTTH
eukprot:364072-Chlamydomonas_euryale.AAC.3